MRYLFVLLLAGCVTPQQRAQEYQQALEQQCHAYGFRSGEAAMANCMMQLDVAVQQRSAASDQAALGLALQMQSQPQPSQSGLTCWRAGEYLRCR